MAKVVYKRGPKAGIDNVAIQDGQIIVTIDTGEIYIDVPNSENEIIRKQFLSGKSIEFKFVQFLPATGEPNIIYFVPKPYPETDNGTDEYIYSNNTWEKIGDTKVDLTDYYTKTEVDNKINAKPGIKTKDGGETFNDTNNVAKWKAHAEGNNTKATANFAHAEGNNTKAVGQMSHAEGNSTQAIGEKSHSEGDLTIASSKAFSIISISKNTMTIKLNNVSGLTSGMAISLYLHSTPDEAANYDFYTTIKSTNSATNTIEVYELPIEQIYYNPSDLSLNYLWVTGHPDLGDIVIGAGAHAEGISTMASQNGAHSEGRETIANGKYSHAEGRGTKAGYAAHAEGWNTVASGETAHASGKNTEASGYASTAMGSNTKVTTFSSTVMGSNTESLYAANQLVTGRYNENKSNTLLEVGNGSSDSDRSNALEVLFDGSGRIKTQGNNDDSIIQKQYVDTKLADKANTNDLSSVATTGSYTDLTNKPTIPTKTSELTNDSGYVTDSELATVATTGNYNDLINKPRIGLGPNAVESIDGFPFMAKYDSNTNEISSTYATKTELETKQDVINSNNKLSYDLISGTPTIPAKTSDLTNDSGFITNAVNNLVNYYLKSETYNKTEVNNLISQIQTSHFEVVTALPAVGESNVIYLLPRQTTETSNIYDEYIYISNAYEKIGSTDVDLTGYATEAWVNTQIAGFLTQSQVQNLINTALTNYYTKSDFVDFTAQDIADLWTEVENS